MFNQFAGHEQGFADQRRNGRPGVRTDSAHVLRKRKAAEMWCKQRRMEYVVATVE